MRLPAVAAIAVLAPGWAFAADLVPAPPPPPVTEPAPVYVPFTWSGTYVGAVGGYGTGDSNHTSAVGVSSGDFTMDGGLAGLTVGHNWQDGALVIGLESDLSWSGIGGSTATAVCGISCSTELDWLGTTRGRLGVAFDRHLLYATGGIAYGEVSSNLVTPAATFGTSDTEVGWTAGAGYEAALGEHWSFKAEYLAVSLPDSNYTAVVPVTVDSGPIHTVRGGINFRF